MPNELKEINAKVSQSMPNLTNTHLIGRKIVKSNAGNDEEIPMRAACMLLSVLQM